MLGPARRRAAALWACALLGCFSSTRAARPSFALRAAAFLGCAHRAQATLGVDKEIVDSALVFQGLEVAEGLDDDADALQCLRAAIAAVITPGTGAGNSPWVNTVVATAYAVTTEGAEHSKVTFSISMSGIDAQTVQDDLKEAIGPLEGADVTTGSLMTELAACGWPYDNLDLEATDRMLETETFRRAALAEVGAVISTALVFDSFGPSYFADDALAVLRFRDLVEGILTAAPVQIDNVRAEGFYGLDEGNNAIHAGTVARGSVIFFDVAVHAWPIGAAVLETPEDLAQVMLNAVVDGRAAGLLDGFASNCDCVLAAGILNVAASQEYIAEVTMHGSHGITSPPVPCTTCGGGDDDDGFDAGARIAIALAAVFCFLGGAMAAVFAFHRRNKFNGCLSPAKRRILNFTGSAELELNSVDPTQRDEVRPAKDVV